ncbi:MAG: PHP domain-containing protein [Rhodoluna sp.]
MKGFTHLHAASAFSGHYGVTRPETMAESVAASGGDALAITDRDGLYGSIKHIGACLKLGISPIVGVNLAILDEAGSPIARTVILAHGHDGGHGWAKLCAIVSAAHASRGKTGQLRKEAQIGIKRSQLASLIGESGGCTILLGPDSDVGRAVLTGPKQLATSLLLAWRECFQNPNSLGVEIVMLLVA